MTKDPVRDAYDNIGGTYSCTVGKILDQLIALSPKPAEIRVEVNPDRLRPIDAGL